MTPPFPEGAYGDRLGGYFELSSAPALVMLRTSSAPFAATRIRCTPDQLGMKQEIPAQDAFVVTLHLVGMRHHELWVRGRPAVVRGYSRGAISIVDLRDEVASYLGSPLDALKFYVPHALVDAVADAAGVARVSALSCLPGLVDPVLGHLGAALLPLLDNPRFANSTMLEHLALAICAHLVRRFGKNTETDVPVTEASAPSRHRLAFDPVTSPQAARRRLHLH